MASEFENKIAKIGSTKYITAPVDMIRSGQKNLEKISGAKKRRVYIFFVGFMVFVVILAIVYFILTQY